MKYARRILLILSIVAAAALFTIGLNVGRDNTAVILTMPTATTSATISPTLEVTAAATAAPSAEPATVSAEESVTSINGYPSTTEVYVSTSSHKIHLRSDCSGMKNYSTMTLGEAESCGYEYCKNCFN